jgi:hypothetical protein
MAKKIQAIRAYGPRLALGKAANEDEYLDLVTKNTGVSRGTVQHVETESAEALVYLLKAGRPVHTATAIYTPSIKQDGRIEVNVLLRDQHVDQLNVSGEFKGQIINALNIGKTTDKLVAVWNAEHPDDPIE